MNTAAICSWIVIDGAVDEDTRDTVYNTIDASSDISGCVVVNVASVKHDVASVINGTTIMGFIVKKLTVTDICLNVFGKWR